MIGNPRANLGTRVGLTLGSIIASQLSAALAVPLLLSEGAIGGTAVRLGCAALLCALWARPDLWSFSAQQWRGAAALGLAVALMSVTFFLAVVRMPVGPAVTIDFLGPLSVAVAALRGIRRIALPLLAAGGIIAMTYGQGGLLFDPVGVLFAVASALGWAGYIVLTRHVGNLFSEQDGLCLALIVATLATLPAAFLLEPDIHATDRLLYLAALAVLWPFATFISEMIALRRLPLGLFSILMSLEPAFGTLAGYLVLDQTLSLRQLAGILTVIITSIVAILLSRDSAAAGQPAAEAG